MKPLKYSWLFLFICVIILSCVEKTTTGNEKYFNIEAYFNAETSALSQQKKGIKKELTENGITEIHTVENADWETELKPFADIALNKPALVNSYIVDSTVENDRKELIFLARDESTTLQQLRILMNQNTPDTIFVVNRVSNMYYRSLDTLVYFGNGNYRISTWNKPRIGKEVSFLLRGSSF